MSARPSKQMVTVIVCWCSHSEVFALKSAESYILVLFNTSVKFEIMNGSYITVCFTWLWAGSIGHGEDR